MRRRIFEDDLAAALATADGAVLGPVNRAQLLSDAERLSPERVVDALRAGGRRAEALNSRERNCRISGRRIARGRYDAGALERQFRRPMRQAARAPFRENAFAARDVILKARLNGKQAVAAIDRSRARASVYHAVYHGRSCLAVAVLCVALLLAAAPARATIRYEISLAHPARTRFTSP